MNYENILFQNEGGIAGIIGLKCCTRDFQAAACGILAGSIGIQRQNNLFRVARHQQFDLRFGQRRAHLRDDVAKARLMRLNRVHIAFDDDGHAAVTDGIFRFIQPEQRPAFVE